MNKFEKFQANYDEAIKTIKQLQGPSEYEPQMNGLVNWLLETDANPYSYLPEGWAGSISSAEGFASLLGVIHHAVYDDGDITFVTVNGEPRIVFVHKFEDNFRNYVLTTQEKEMENGAWRTEYDVKFLDIEPNEFGVIYDAFQIKEIKRWFTSDARAHGVEWAASHYRSYKLWNEAWVEEYKTKNS